jgi:Family of unknown function (DUF5683)
MNKVILFLLFFAMALTAAAQDPQTRKDTLMVEPYQDTVLIESYAKRYNPRKALLYAAVVPGLGQIYNKKYWKLPLVYGGLFACGYAVKFYGDQYTDYRSIVFQAVEKGTGENEIDEDLGMQNTLSSYRTATDRARRERDFYMIVMAGVYLLQIIDAHVDAHLKEFDLNPNLRVQIEPMMEDNYYAGRSTGLSLLLKF